MANENVTIRRGFSTSTPETKIPGQILVETDTGTLYIDDTLESRVQIKDNTKLPLTGGKLTGNNSNNGLLLYGYNDSFTSPVVGLIDGTNKILLAQKQIRVEDSSNSYSSNMKAGLVTLNSGTSSSVTINGSNVLVSNTSGKKSSYGLNSISLFESSTSDLVLQVDDEDATPKITLRSYINGPGQQEFTITPSGVSGTLYAKANWRTWLEIPDTLSDLGTFTATANNLAAGSAPTVSVNGTEFTFGIPKGDKGDDGLTTAVSIGGVTTQHVDGTVTIPNTSVYKAMNTGTMTVGHVVVYSTSDGQLKDGGFTVSTDVPANAKFTDTTYSGGTAISINNNEISHKNYGTAGTKGPGVGGRLGWDSTFVVPCITTNDQGHVTTMNGRTFTMPSDPKDYTGDLAGNAASANKLKTARSITLEGAVTGTNTFDGSENITITTSLGDIDDGDLF